MFLRNWNIKSNKTIGISLLATLAVMVFSVFHLVKRDAISTIEQEFANASGLGQEIVKDLRHWPRLNLAEATSTYSVSDKKADGPDVKTASNTEEEMRSAEDKFEVEFPRSYLKSVKLKLDAQRTVEMTDKNNLYYESSLLYDKEENGAAKEVTRALFDRKTTDAPENIQNTAGAQYVRYRSDDGRKTLYYTYQKRPENGLRQIKNWVYYNNGSGKESESYSFENARLRLNKNGEVEGYFWGVQNIQNEEAGKKAGADLFKRAKLTLEKEEGLDIMNGNRTPDFIIPKPYILDKNKNRTDLNWTVAEDGKSITVAFDVGKGNYPVALDPTLQFTAPGQASEGEKIDGEAASEKFGFSIIGGDYNGDGKADLVVSARDYNSNAGRVYIFYGNNSYALSASSADVIIDGESGSLFGSALTAGDFNTDGKTDLVVGAHFYSTRTGRAYIFYNDGSYTATASTADVIISGEMASNYFGVSLTAGDFNTDGKTDLVVGGNSINGQSGRTYIFYNDGSYTATASTADVIISGETGLYKFGSSLVAGDFNADGKTDLVVGADNYSNGTGRAYIFYNDGSYTATASTADTIITGEAQNSSFSLSLISGDFNADGKTDLVVGGKQYSMGIGRVYIFYNDGSYAATASTADIIITGEGTVNYLGSAFVTGDFNGDGKIDLVIGASSYATSTGRAYVFYGGNIISTVASSADVIITGEGINSYFGSSLTSGDFDDDRKADIAIGAYGYNSSAGSAYIFYSNNGFVDSSQKTVSEGGSFDFAKDFGAAMATGDFNADGKIDLAVSANNTYISTTKVYIFYNDNSIPSFAASADVIITDQTDAAFGQSLAAGDFNADGKTDLAVGARRPDTYTGYVYIFYNDGSMPSTSAAADVVIAGQATNSYFGWAMTAGDFNTDGKTDLAVGATRYSSYTGRAYVFYNDGSYPANAASADVAITGSTTNYYFGSSLAAGDYNSDGRVDLAVGGYGYSSYTGRAHIFYNDGTIPTTTATADVIITGGGSSNNFGIAMVSGDFNTDGKTDLAVGADRYSSYTGRAYIFYNDGTIPTTTATADITITGEAISNQFGYALSASDLNDDGRTDLAVGAYYYNSFTGRAYVFYNDGAMPTTASTADLKITSSEGMSYFASALANGDFNSDGKTDLVVGASSFGAYNGETFIFFNDGTMPTSTDTADISIAAEGAVEGGFGSVFAAGDLNVDGRTDLIVGTGEKLYLFYNNADLPETIVDADVVIDGNYANIGWSLSLGDWNDDGRLDLAASDPGYSSSAGSVFVFWNDGSIPTSASSADVVIVGEASDDNFGKALVSGDWDADGKTDLAVGGPGYGTSLGRFYIFNNGFASTFASSADLMVTGESGYFGESLVSGDFDSDGSDDLAVGAIYSDKVYIFYSDSGIPTTASSADVIIDGVAGTNFGSYLAAGDFNGDDRADLAVDADWYYGGTGRVYLFYNDGTYPILASTSDGMFTGEKWSHFGADKNMLFADLNADGKDDLIVGAKQYSEMDYTGRVYVFYGGGTTTAVATSADVMIDGNEPYTYFGTSLVAGDFNADGGIDLAVGSSESNGIIHFFLTGVRQPEGRLRGNVRMRGAVKMR